MAKINIEFGWVVLRDPRSVRDRERKMVLQAAAGMTQEDLDDLAKRRGDHLFAVHDFENVFASVMVESWSFPEEISPEGVADLPWVTRNELTELVAPLWGDLFPSFAPDVDEESPTVPSSE